MSCWKISSEEGSTEIVAGPEVDGRRKSPQVSLVTTSLSDTVLRHDRHSNLFSELVSTQSTSRRSYEQTWLETSQSEPRAYVSERSKHNITPHKPCTRCPSLTAVNTYSPDTTISPVQEGVTLALGVGGQWSQSRCRSAPL